MKLWLQRILATGSQTIRGLIAPARAVRLALVLVLSAGIAWLIVPPSPDVMLPIPHSMNVEFSADGSRMLIRSVEKGITPYDNKQRFTLWDVPQHRIIHSFVTNNGNAGWTPDGKLLVLASSPGIRVVDPASGKTLSEFDFAANPPTKWTSNHVSEPIMQSLHTLADRKEQTYPHSLRLITSNLMVVDTVLSESPQHILFQRVFSGGSCERRFRIPDLHDAGTELFSRLQPLHTDAAPLIVAAELANYSDPDWIEQQASCRGWRLLDPATLQTRVWIPEPSRQPRIAGLSADGTVLATGLASRPSAEQRTNEAARANDWGVKLYDAAVGGLLRTFPDEVNPQFSPDGATLLTQQVHADDFRQPPVVRMRDAATGALISETDVSRVARSLGQTVEDRTETDRALAKGLRPSAVPPPRGTSYEILTTSDPSVPFVAVRSNSGTQVRWLNRLRRRTSEHDLIDLKQGKLLAHLPGCHAVSPDLSWAVERREKDVGLWKLHGWRWPQFGLASLLVLGALVIESLMYLWFARLRAIGAIETTSGNFS